MNRNAGSVAMGSLICAMRVALARKSARAACRLLSEACCGRACGVITAAPVRIPAAFRRVILMTFIVNSTQAPGHKIRNAEMAGAGRGRPQQD